MKTIIIKEDAAEQRLDRFLLKYFNDTTRSNIYKLIRKKVFKVNGVRVKEDYILRLDDQLDVYLADASIEAMIKEEEMPTATEIGLDIVYEDDDVLVLNKPKGILTHPDANEYSKTLSTAVQMYLKHLCTRTFKPAPVHRLDKNTSGIVIFAKTYEALKHYNALMRNREIEKFYICVVEGRLQSAGVLKGYLTKDEKYNKVMISKNDQDESKFFHTVYKPLKHVSGFTLVSVQLITGRTHQIRATMQHIGHPIVGDVKYGGKKRKNAPSQLLHSNQIKVGNHTFQSESQEINQFLQNL